MLIYDEKPFQKLLTILVKIFSYKKTVGVFLLQVTPPKYSNMMESQGQLDNLFASGDIDRAMQMAFALLSAAGDSDGAQSVSLLNCGKLT